MTTAISTDKKDVVITQAAESASEFLRLLKKFEPEAFNKVPFAGSWTPAQVAEHVLKSITGMPDMLRGKTSRTDRDAEAHVPQIRELFLDFSTKMKSPDFILPSDGPKDQQQIITDLQQQFDGTIAAARMVDLSATLEAFEFPGVGKLTGIELLNFLEVHTRRHSNQLQNIGKVLR